MVKKTERFPCIGLDETNFHLANSTFRSNFTSSSYPYDNLKDSGIYGDEGGNDYARINVDKTPSSDSYIYALFDLSSIPDNAVITQTTGNIRLYSSGTRASYKQIRWCIDDINTPLRTSQNFGTSSNPSEIEVSPLKTGITLEELKRVKCYIHYQRNSYADNTQRYIYLYGACIDVTYQVPSTTLFIKKNNQWTSVKKAYKKINGVWIEQNIAETFEENVKYVKIDL